MRVVPLNTLQAPAAAQPRPAPPISQQTSAKQADIIRQLPSSAKKTTPHGSKKGSASGKPRDTGDDHVAQQGSEARDSLPEDAARASKRQRLGVIPEGQGRALELPGDALPLPLDPPEPLKRPSAHAVRWSQNQLDTHLQTVLRVVKVSVVVTSCCRLHSMVHSCKQEEDT